MLYTVSGLLLGFLVGLTGVGGGSLMTPLMVGVFGFSPAMAVGTDLVYAFVTKLAGTRYHQKKGSVKWDVVKWMALGSVPAALFSLWILRLLGDYKASTPILWGLGLLLILTAFCLLTRDKLLAFLGRFPTADNMALVAVGVLLGIAVTFTSIGAGALGIVALTALRGRELAPRELVATDLAHALPLTAVAGAGHFFMGHIQWNILGLLLLGSVPGVLLGSCCSTRISGAKLQKALALILLVVGGRFLLM